MKKVRNGFCSAVVLAAMIGFISPAFAAKYTNGGGAGKYSEQPPEYAKKKLPSQATEMPMEDLKSSAAVTFDELRSFVRDWRKYARWLKTDGNEYKAVAYLGVSKTMDYPPEVLKWMDEHGWAADRFFLLERKFRITLSVQQQEIKQETLKSHLQQQIKMLDENKALPAEKKKEMKEQYERTLVSLLSSPYTKAPVTPEEYELIKLNRDALMRILSE